MKEPDKKPGLEDSKSKFQCEILRGSLRATVTEPITHEFIEFQVNTIPDQDECDGDSEEENRGLIQVADPELEDDCDKDPELEGNSTPSSSLDPNFEAHGPRLGKQREAPTQPKTKAALKDLEELLNPPRKKGQGHVDPNLDLFVRLRMEGMQMLLNFYTNEQSTTYDAWGASSCQSAIALGRGQHCAQQLRLLTRQFIQDRNILPINPYGGWNESMLVDEDLANDLNLYLQEIGKEISGKKVQEFLNREDIRSKHGIDKLICERTAQRYLNELGYRFTQPKKGQYVDGHEREDVIHYREQVFLPQWQKIQDRMESWTKENILEPRDPIPGRRVIVWFHDESIFYTHDRRKKAWYHKDAPAKPYTKGEGASLMIADYVSADFGWLCLPDGKRSARQVMKPGKNKDGYFSSDDICNQAQEAIGIVRECWPQYEHVFVYDNASTHLKRPEDSLSARKMPKKITALGTNWGIEVSKRDPISGKIIYKPDGSPEKTKICMSPACFADGTPQPLYFPEGHEHAGAFKGMAKILEERGFGDMSKVLAQCKGFKCAPAIPGVPQRCCCRRILYNEPDFANVESRLEATCKALGVLVIFLPKFHCELNFIEQCWGYAKRIYRLNPESSREDILEKNALAALETIPLPTMRRFANRSRRFMDAYGRGLNGRQAAWAARKFRGHRVLPASIMEELEKANVV
jgi:hypothetical protein